MSDHAFDFLESWIVENVNAKMFEDKGTAERLAQDCVWEAQTRGIAKADLIEAAGGDLNVYMRAELNRVFNRKVEYRSRRTCTDRVGPITCWVGRWNGTPVYRRKPPPRPLVIPGQAICLCADPNRLAIVDRSPTPHRRRGASSQPNGSSVQTDVWPPRWHGRRF